MQQRKESNYINKDLLALKECISAIACKQSKIPFRNSSLTRVLQRALCCRPPTEGQTAVLLATVSPEASNRLSTTNTLRYAQILTGRTKERASTGRPNPFASAKALGGPKPWQTASKPKMKPKPLTDKR